MALCVLSLILASDRCLAALSRHLQEAAETRRGSVHLDSDRSTPSWLARNKVSGQQGILVRNNMFCRIRVDQREARPYAQITPACLHNLERHKPLPERLTGGELRAGRAGRRPLGARFRLRTQ